MPWEAEPSDNMDGSTPNNDTQSRVLTKSQEQLIKD